jgi:hypothetical protein
MMFRVFFIERIMSASALRSSGRWLGLSSRPHMQPGHLHGVFFEHRPMTVRMRKKTNVDMCTSRCGWPASSPVLGSMYNVGVVG